MDQIEDDLALAETSNALERLFGTDKAAPEASEEIYVSLWDKLPIELQEVIVTFVRKQRARKRQQLNQEVKHYVYLYNSWNGTLFRVLLRVKPPNLNLVTRHVLIFLHLLSNHVRKNETILLR